MSANPHTETGFHPRQTTETRAGRAPFQASCPTSHELRRYLREEDAGNRAYGAQVSSTPIPTKARGGVRLQANCHGRRAPAARVSKAAPLTGLDRRAPQCADNEHWKAMYVNHRTAHSD